MKFRKAFLLVCIAAAMVVFFSACAKTNTQDTSANDQQKQEVKSSYPEKTIKLINYVPKGSGPDVVNRKVAELLEQKEGWKFEITNVPGNIGSDAAKAVWDAPHDGYTILGASENLMTYAVYGLSDKTMKDWIHFESTLDTTLIVVPESSPYKTLSDLVNAAKSKPNTIGIGNTGAGKTFHLKAKLLEKVSGAQFVHVDYKTVPALLDALQKGEADSASATASMLMPLIQSGKVRPLIVTDVNSLDFGSNIGMIDSIVSIYPEAKKSLPMDAAIGMAMPADVPEDVVKAFGEAYQRVMESPEMDDYLASRYYIKIGLWGDDAKDYVLNTERNISWFIHEIGLSKKNPADFGIEKPQN